MSSPEPGRGSTGDAPAGPEGRGSDDRLPGPARRGSGDAPAGPAVGVLIVGYGNTLRSDDGVGVRAAEVLAGDPRLAGANVLAVHQLAPDLALEMSRASLVVLIDASMDVPPGEVSVRRLAGGGPMGQPAAVATPRGAGSSSHHVGPAELLDLAAELYGAAPGIVVVSVGAAALDLGESLSPVVAAALPIVAEVIADLVGGHASRCR